MPSKVVFGSSVKNSNRIEPKEVEHEIQLEVFKFYYKYGFLNPLLYFIKGCKIINQILKQNGPPMLIHLHVTWNAGLLALWFKKVKKIKYVLTEHWSGLNKDDKNNLFKQNFIKQWLFKKIVSNAEYVFPVSGDLGKRLSVWNNNITVIPNVVNTSYFNYENPIMNNNFRFIHVSGMGYEKNVPSIIEAFKNIVKKYPESTLKLVGPLPKEIEKLIKEEPNILTTGEIPYQAVANEIKSSSALILFSLFENLPCVILEALCCGKPVIASNVGGISEVVDDNNGILVERNNIKELEAAMITMIENYDKFNAKDISARAKLHFSYEIVAQQYINAYSKII